MSYIHNKWLHHPKIFQINTWPWLNSLSELQNREINLLNIPEGIVDLDLSQFDAIWLMGIWERSPRGKEIAIKHPDLQGEYRKALNDYIPDDVVGSPYAVHDYRADYHLGSNDGLELFRDILIEDGILLMLDYVPNHVAIDHLWTEDNPEIFIQGKMNDLEKLPHDYFLVQDHVIAHGRDPNFYPWTDTAQINAFSREARQMTIETLCNIASQCDGVRCDMAMLLTNETFNRTWGARAGPPLKQEFWMEIIPAVKEKFPNFLFMAEVYWEMEWKLMEQGFDFCYDKRLYDRLKNGNANTIKSHLNADWDYQKRLVRFIENHDEQRTAIGFGEERSKAAAMLILTLPGARLIHEGQMMGYKRKIPVQLGRRAVEKDNLELMEFYLKLLNAAPDRKFDEAKWALCQVKPINFSFTNLISYIWWTEEERRLIVVNFSPYPAQGHVLIPSIVYGQESWNFTDLLTMDTFIYEGENLANHGLFIDLSAWSGHIFDIKKASNNY